MSHDKHCIAIIGVGAVGVSMIIHLVKDLIASRAAATEILAFERSGRFGTGVAYQPDLDAAILNRTRHNMSAQPQYPADFANWLARQPDPDCADADYLPRPLFGRYLQDALQQAVDLAATTGHRVRLIPAEIIDVKRQEDVYLLLSDRDTWRVKHLILATGNQRSGQFLHLRDKPGYRHSPYPLVQTCRAIHPEQRVAIIGSRLSAVDTVIALSRQGHRGPITLMSRQGYLPMAQLPQANAPLRYCTVERIAAQKTACGGWLSLRMVFRLVLKELSAAAGCRFSAKRHKPLKGDAAALLDLDIQALDAGPRNWQAVFVALNAVIDELWRSLRPQDQQRFRDFGYSRFMALRVPIPLPSALTLQKLLKREQLEIRSGIRRIDHADGGFLAQFEDGSQAMFDIVVNATSSDNRLQNTADPLYAALLREQLAIAHPLGGVEVDWADNQVLAPSGAPSGGLYAVGNMTCGTHLFCSVYETNTRHCQRISRQLTERLHRPATHPI
ncbi:FAD/NAD(P)-binding protein [Chromobacterium alticapitis]|uniref:FAD-dependent urate hydroxylase HpyO/Asp monooxygenase CreE-like FAD/NAD(P)-binding domain-containing protein n=1 Tax=Chromobacterium alticapitis TaxID=2073169 RepID=A0A2S5DG45_9NEIS|nr:FAD/NAD(P)-binding protein [Chromobacterium alticapitis]POZ62056.1 hypothetical protein C2I19_10385 [Chromobacterium alticapitis]